MRLAISLLLALPALVQAASGLPYFSVLAENPGAWPAILRSIGFQQTPPTMARVFVLPDNPSATPDWATQVESGAVVILAGESALAGMFGFQPTKETVRVGSLVDMHAPDLPIIWEHALELPRFNIPPGGQVFARERWSGAPMMAGCRRGSGAVLWVAVSPGERGYERFPYLLHALADLGLEPPFQSSRLWALFDYSYRVRVDLDYFAERWRKAGIAALHVAAWHFWEPDAERDQYLLSLIAACHRQGILVYAWLEFPHVSDRFWSEHPQWREKTAVGQDAQLDWRKLMNLNNLECFRTVAKGLRGLFERFDWDGVNLAELYFESLEGISNPSRFTPMNPDVRAEFQAANGFDPVEIFGARGDAASRRAFLDFRADLARRMQEGWLAELDAVRRERPYLELVLTHVDDRFDTGMRDAIGADAARILPMLEQRAFTFLVEDPATIWHLGPQRYQEIARRYQALTSRQDRLAIDINIVERYQSVYPTKQQTGTELFQLVHEASLAFSRVALYGENSLLGTDLPLLPSAAAMVSRVERIGGKLAVESRWGVGISWRGGARVDGRPYPVRSETVLWLPAGAHTVEPAAVEGTPARVVHFAGDLQTARYTSSGAMQLGYNSGARVYAVLDRAPVRVEVDGVETPADVQGPSTIRLPRGQHLVTIQTR